MTATILNTPEAFTSTAPTLAVAAGRNLIAAGSIFGLANLFQYAVVSGALGLHPAILSLSWPIAVGLFLTFLFRLRRSGGQAAQCAGAWSRFAILAQIAAALTLAGLSAWTGDWALMMWMSAVGMGLYGAAWAVATVRGGRAWMAVIALGCFGCASSIALLVGTPDQYLTYAVGLFAFALAPGLGLASGRIR